MFTTRHAISLDFRSPRQPQVNEPSSTLPVRRHSADGSTLEPGGQRKQKSRMVSFRLDEDDFIGLEALSRQTSCSRAEVLRRCQPPQAELRASRSRACGESSRRAIGRAPVIVRHQRRSTSGKGFRQLARYIRGRSTDPRAIWFLGAHGVELACRLLEGVQAQNTRAGKDRTHHLVISLHPKDRSLDRKELRYVVEHLVDVLGFSEQQYIAARHSDKDHEHVRVAINKIHPESFRYDMKTGEVVLLAD